MIYCLKCAHMSPFHQDLPAAIVKCKKTSKVHSTMQLFLEIKIIMLSFLRSDTFKVVNTIIAMLYYNDVGGYIAVNFFNIQETGEIQ